MFGVWRVVEKGLRGFVAQVDTAVDTAIALHWPTVIAAARVFGAREERERERECESLMVIDGASGEAAVLRTFEEAKSTLYGTISAAGAALDKASRCALTFLVL